MLAVDHAGVTLAILRKTPQGWLSQGLGEEFARVHRHDTLWEVIVYAECQITDYLGYLGTPLFYDIIEKGMKVRSHDFPDNILIPERNRSRYVEGIVLEANEEYVLVSPTKREWCKKEKELTRQNSFPIQVPQNGLKNLFGMFPTTRGIEII